MGTKKIIAFLVSGIIIFSLSGCGIVARFSKFHSEKSESQNETTTNVIEDICSKLENGVSHEDWIDYAAEVKFNTSKGVGWSKIYVSKGSLSEVTDDLRLLFSEYSSMDNSMMGYKYMPVSESMRTILISDCDGENALAVSVNSHAGSCFELYCELSKIVGNSLGLSLIYDDFVLDLYEDNAEVLDLNTAEKTVFPLPESWVSPIADESKLATVYNYLELREVDRESGTLRVSYNSNKTAYLFDVSTIYPSPEGTDILDKCYYNTEFYSAQTVLFLQGEWENY